jgi:hypothetical protein
VFRSKFTELEEDKEKADADVKELEEENQPSG